MNSKEIIIKVTNNRVYFNPQLDILISYTNIPIEHFSFKSFLEIFWLVEMKDFDQDSRCLKVSIKDYNFKIDDHKSRFEAQAPKKEIKQLLFDKLDWMELQPLLGYYQKSKLIRILENIDINTFADRNSSSYGEKLNPLSIDKTLDSFKDEETKMEPVPKIIIDEFRIDFNRLNFKLGYVTSQKYCNKLQKSLNFRIENENLLEEFDHIKHWFAKKLKLKKIKVSMEITLIDGEVENIIAQSKHIDKINSELIESIKYQRTIALTKEPRISNVDKSLFTSDDIFSQFSSDETEGNIFNQNDDEILKFLMDYKKTRNRKHLAYLSGKKQTQGHKLRYTLNPHFGFLFLVEGNTNNHFIWELLNSHATYIWSFDKTRNNIRLQFQRIESIINVIRATGRQNYKNAYINNHQDNDLVFRIIKHDSIKSALVDDFPKWKSTLNEQLI